MKTLKIKALAIFLIVGTALIAQDKKELKPTQDLLLFKVTVTDFENVPMKGNQITFYDKKSKKEYKGVSDENGRFDVLIPKNVDLQVRANFLGKDSVIREIPSITQKGLGTVNYTLRYAMVKNVTLEGIYFDTAKWDIKPQSEETLTNLFEYLDSDKDAVVEIAGHTDNVGSDESNMKLSQHRAESVKNWLVKKGIAENRLVAKGYGETQPKETNDTPEGRAKNRRTEVSRIEAPAPTPATATPKK